jgi:predicted ribosomally synthesized peptide with nif11-like leader
MSTQAVHDFWQKAQTDPLLRQQLQGARTDDNARSNAAVAKIAAAAGFSFTAEEYDATLKEELARRFAAGELSQEELGQVAGGCYKASCLEYSTS